MLHKKFAIVLWIHIIPCNGALIPVHNREGKLSLIEWTNYNYREPEGFGTYAFGYDVEDPDTNNIQFRNEEKLSNGSVVGSYGYLESTGNALIVRYIADQEGYRAIVENSTKLKFFKPFLLAPFGFRSAENTSDNTNVGSEVSDENSNNVGNDKTSNASRSSNATDQIGRHGQYAFLHNNNESSEQNYSTLNFSQNILTSHNFNGSEKKSSTKKYLYPDFSSEEESNSFYYPPNILENPDSYTTENSNDKIIFQKNYRISKKETPFRERINNKIRNVSRLTLSKLVSMISQTTTELSSSLGNNEPHNNEEKNKDQNKDYSNARLKFEKNIFYPSSAVFSSSMKNHQEVDDFRQISNENGIIPSTKLTEKLGKYIQKKRISRESELNARIFTPEVSNPPSPSPIVSPCSGFQSSYNNNWFNENKFSVNSKSTMQSSEFGSSHIVNEASQKTLEKEQLLKDLKILRIVTPHQNIFSPSTVFTTYRPCS